MFTSRRTIEVSPSVVERSSLPTTLYPSNPLTASFYRDWETDRKSTRLNSSHSAKSRMPSSA